MDIAEILPTKMARTVKDTKIESRAARAKLAQRREHYWRAIGPGTHIGYYVPSRKRGWPMGWVDPAHVTQKRIRITNPN